MKLPDGRVVQIEPDWFGKLSGFTLLFEALALAMAQQMTFVAVARLVNESGHRVHAICSRYVDLAEAEADLSTVVAVALRPPAASGRRHAAMEDKDVSHARMIEFEPVRPLIYHLASSG